MPLYLKCTNPWRSVRIMVLDEADKLMELGFLEQMDTIISSCTHSDLRKHMFSATIPSGVEQLGSQLMLDPLRIVIGAKNAATADITQRLLYVGLEQGKIMAIRNLIQEGFTPPVLIFCQSIQRSKELLQELLYDGIKGIYTLLFC